MGLGLMGGSIAKAIKKYTTAHITAITLNQQEAKQALLDGSIDQCVRLDALNSDVELVFVCTPMKDIKEHILQLTRHCSQQTIITDIASAKGFLANENFADNVILGHPIAGSEKKGYFHADADLFKNRSYVVIPPKVVDTRYERLKELIDTIGARVIECDAQTHDQQLALSSHAPYVMAKLALDVSRSMGLDSRFIGPGFESFTRVGHSDPAWGKAVTTLNSEAVKSVLDAYSQALNQHLVQLN